MNTYKHLFHMVGIFALVATAAVFATKQAFATADTFQPGVNVFDNFDNNATLLQPNTGGYWWIEGQGTAADGSGARVRADHACDLQTCVKIATDGDGTSYVRAQGSPTTTTTNYTNANLSEQVDGADGDLVFGGQTYPGEWNPTVGHPVVVEGRMRFGPNFNKDGSGGANGSAGLWLWNNPFSQGASDPFSIYNGIGFTWISKDSEIDQGLNMTVIKGAFPIFAVPVTANININDWNTYKFVWATDLLGNQTVTFYVNGALQGVAPMPVGVSAMQNMGLEYWLDDQAFKPSQYPNYIQRVPVTQERHVDLDSVSIVKN